MSIACTATIANAQVYLPPKAAYQALPVDPTTIVAGPHAFYIAPIASLYATQANLGGFEVAKKTANDTPPFGKHAGYYPIDSLTATSTLPTVAGTVNALNASLTVNGPATLELTGSSLNYRPYHGQQRCHAAPEDGRRYQSDDV